MYSNTFTNAAIKAGAGRGPLGRLIGRAVTRAAERRSLEQLSRLDDRLLRDVGLTRADVAQLLDGR